jgi:hypothetical protein
VYRVFVGRPEGGRPLERPRRRWENNIKMDLQDVKWVPVTTAWRVLGLRMEERPPGLEGSCEYIE